MPRDRITGPLGLIVVGLVVLSSWLAAAERADRPRDASRLPPSKVTLQGRKSLDEAVAALQQSGNVIVDLRRRLGQEIRRPTLNLRLVGAPFWRAVDEVNRQAMIEMTPLIDPGRHEPVLGITQPDRPPTPVPTAYDGPFRITVVELTAVRRLDDPRLSTLLARLQIAWEPRLRPLFMRVAPDSVRASGTDGFRTVDQGGVGTIKLVGVYPAELSLRLPLPPRSWASLPKLKGSFDVIVPPTQARFTFTKLVTGEKQSDRGVTATLREIVADRHRRRWTVVLTLVYPWDKLPLESHQIWAMEGNRIQLVHRTENLQWQAEPDEQVSIDEGRAIHITYHFADVPGKLADWTLVYIAPAAPIWYDLDFTFDNLPLP